MVVPRNGTANKVNSKAKQYTAPDKETIEKFIAPDKALFFNQNILIVFSFLHENIWCGTH